MHIKPIIVRDPKEAHRAATMLELFFDLVSVVAIAAAATGLHHAYAHGDILESIFKFFYTFTAIWWAWVNYTWYASAFDNDDVSHRLGTMVIMAGALIMAAGIPAFFESESLTLLISGYVVMRLGMAFMWWRVFNSEGHEWKAAAKRYGIGLVILQILWVTIAIFFEPPVIYPILVVVFIGELLLPAIGEGNNPTPWHRHHIIERYGLLNIIVLGESLLAVGIAIQAAYHNEHLDWSMAGLAVSGMIIVCAMWWLYFSETHIPSLMGKSRTIIWTYGHIILFASGAAVGAGLAVMVEVLEHAAHISMQMGIASVAVPAGLFVFGLWFIHGRFEHSSRQKFVLPVTVILLWLTPFFNLGIYPVAAILTLCVVAKYLLTSSKQ